MAAAKKNSKTKALAPATPQDDDVVEAQKKSTDVSTQALALTCTTDAEYDTAASFLTAIADAEKFVEGKRTSITKPLNAALTATNALFNPMKSALTNAKAHVRRIMGEHADRKEQERRRQQAEADERARKERERLEKQAQKAEASGKTEKAELLQRQASTVAAPVIASAPPKAAGIALVDTWKFEVTDPAKISAAYQTPDLQKIGDTVRALKNVDEARAVIGEGVRVWCEKLPKTTGR